MSCLRSIVGVRRMDRIRNVDVREACGIQKGVEMRREIGLLGWFGHVQRMDINRIVKRIYESSCEGNGLRGRPTNLWKKGVNEHLSERGRSLEGVGILVRDRDRWREFVLGKWT